MKNFGGRSSNILVAGLALGVIFVTAFACNFKSDEDWKRDLANKKLSRASNSGSISDKVDFYFCPTGEYAKETQFSGFSPGGSGTLSMADSGVELGRWSVRSGTLILQPQNGEISEYSISGGSDDNVIELNGNGHLVTTHNECR